MKEFSLFRMVAVSLFAAFPLCFNSCATIMPGTGSVMPGVLYNAITVPGDLTDDLLYSAYPDSFTVIGRVEGTSGAMNILGLFSFGNAGYIAAIEDAKTSVGADGIINCTGDISGQSLLVFFARSKTVVQGYAIKRK